MDNEKAFLLAVNNILIDAQKHCGWCLKALPLKGVKCGWNIAKRLYSYFIPATFHKKEEWAETAKSIDNEVNSEKNKEDVRALLSLIVDYKY